MHVLKEILHKIPKIDFIQECYYVCWNNDICIIYHKISINKAWVVFGYNFKTSCSPPKPYITILDTNTMMPMEYYDMDVKLVSKNIFNDYPELCFFGDFFETPRKD